MQRRWLATAVIGGSLLIIGLIGSNLQSELAPLDDRSYLRMSFTGPEGASYEFTDDVVNRIVTLVNDSIPEKRVSLSFIGGFTSTNNGNIRVMLAEPSERKRTQQEIADYLSF